MSFVIATPDLVESAAANLAAIRSSLADAASMAAAPTTGIAAAAQDEVSLAIASLFGNFGQEFQALSAQAQAFHEQFVSVMNAGVGAYAGAEATNVEQVLLGGDVVGNAGQSLGGALAGGPASVTGLVTALQDGGIGGLVGSELHTGAQAVSNAIAGVPLMSGVLQTGGVGVVNGLNGLNGLGATVAAPYQALVSNAVTNVQAIGATFSANPFPFLHQVVNNQIGYAQTIASSIATGVQNLPTELAHLPASIQAGLQGLSITNPGAFPQQFVNNQIGYAQTIGTGLNNATRDLITGVQTLPPGFVTAAQDLFTGDNVGAYRAVNQALINAFLPGLTANETDLGSSIVVNITPQGPLGDLAPIFSIPGQMAQNFTNLLPAGSVPAQMAQNATNVISALTDFGTTITIGSTANLTFGLPLQLVLDGVGAPINALASLNSSAAAFVGAAQVGNASVAAAALLDAPAVVANGFLNGSTVISLPPATVSLLGVDLPSTTSITLGGLLTPLSLPQVVVDLDGFSLPLLLTGDTPTGGLIPGLVSLGTQLAQVITPTP
jgi:PE family